MSGCSQSRGGLQEDVTLLQNINFKGNETEIEKGDGARWELRLMITCFVWLYVLMDQACMSDIVVSFSNLNWIGGKKGPCDMWTTVGWIVFSVVCRQSDAMKSYENSRFFTQCFTPCLMCYSKYSHMQKWRFPHFKWQLISQKWPKGFTVKPTERWRVGGLFALKQSNTQNCLWEKLISLSSVTWL